MLDVGSKTARTAGATAVAESFFQLGRHMDNAILAVSKFVHGSLGRLNFWQYFGSVQWIKPIIYKDQLNTLGNKFICFAFT